MPIQIATFKALCRQCQSAFSIPLLSEAAYGEFVARGETGKASAYLNTLEDGNWDRITSLYDQIVATPLSDSWKESDRLHWVIGKCLDSIESEKLSLVDGPVCPFCHSHQVSYSDDIKTGYITLQDASFKQFSSTTEDEQVEYIRNLLTSYFQVVH